MRFAVLGADMWVYKAFRLTPAFYPRYTPIFLNLENIKEDLSRTNNFVEIMEGNHEFS